MDEDAERRWAEENADASGYALRTVWSVDYSFDPKTGEGTKTTIEHDKVVNVRPAHISEIF